MFDRLRQLLGLKKSLREVIEEHFFDLVEAGISPSVIEGWKESGYETLEEAIRNTLLEGRLRDPPLKIVLVGINGSGKTTTAGKLALWFKKRGYSVSLGAADTFRAGSIEQLEEIGISIGVQVVKHRYGSDPAAVAFDAVRTGSDVVIVDTAGRQEVNRNLMEELKKVKRVVKPDYTIMVVDATTGVEASEQASTFDREVGIDGFIVTRMDLDRKGGTIVNLCHATGKPVYFIGTGEKLEDLEPFDRERFVKELVRSI